MRSINPNGPGTPTKLSAAMDLATAAAVPHGSPAQAPASFVHFKSQRKIGPSSRGIISIIPTIIYRKNKNIINITP